MKIYGITISVVLVSIFVLSTIEVAPRSDAAQADVRELMSNAAPVASVQSVMRGRRTMLA